MKKKENSEFKNHFSIFPKLWSCFHCRAGGLIWQQFGAHFSFVSNEVFLFPDTLISFTLDIHTPLHVYFYTRVYQRASRYNCTPRIACKYLLFHVHKYLHIIFEMHINMHSEIKKCIQNTSLEIQCEEKNSIHKCHFQMLSSNIHTCIYRYIGKRFHWSFCWRTDRFLRKRSLSIKITNCKVNQCLIYTALKLD